MTDFGSDLSCVQDLDPAFAVVSGRRGLGQALARRIITGRGTLVGDANYGFDLRQYIQDGLTTAQLGKISSQVDAEFLKDERVLRSTTTMTFLAGVLTLSCVIVDAAGPFRLVLAVTDVTSTVLQVQGA